MRYILYQAVSVYSLPNEEEKQVAEKEIRANLFHGSFMDPDVDFDYLPDVDDLIIDFDSGHDLAEHLFDLHVDAWSW